jgi:hypothetical protein
MEGTIDAVYSKRDNARLIKQASFYGEVLCWPSVHCIELLQ